MKNIIKKGIQTVKQAVLTLVKIMGFVPSQKQPFPGIKILAQFLERFYFIKLGAEVAQIKPLTSLFFGRRGECQTTI
ncbi:MAG: hypothetical protein EAZ70_11230 [Runella slithyformis]|nr:MAG: hypothetical protein EAY79_11520 [Runella slithyformis]TAF00372.1 MAG: hypothetical protein EAZ80_03870 [Runella slithyformis]TAF24800.1 MAG: hypothetical protein EAZ70_11230 [Runella slithyformis]TAF49643.1 MAG: hypothetical protein EAZ63_00730 [Runella slithyformis]TAF81049.1 MAG: hypothetical protein EAZ50_07345 [Runella slithyformis]